MRGVKISIEGKEVAVADMTPPGVISQFGGYSIPSGWLLCDGSEVSRTTYADLFAAIGTSFGYGNQSTTFNLPDLRGRFLRGVDGSAGIDPDKTTRTALKAGGNTGNAVGSAQPCATKQTSLATVANTTGNDSPDHTHQYKSTGVDNSPYSNGGSGPGSGSTGNGSAHTHSIPSLTITGGDQESRPTNVYLNYIIKF